MMTKIPHYVSSISQKDDWVWVIFKEIVSNKVVIKYIKDAKESWERQGLPGELPKSTIQQLREHRFKNEFEMKFPFPQWSKRDLKIMDRVDIDMPLQLKDIVSVGMDEGI